MVHVALDVPVPRLFTYVVPEGLQGRLAPGQRVRVPFRGRARVGWVVGLGDEPGEGRALSPVSEPVDPVAVLPASLLAVSRWVAAETVSAWGEVLGRAIPPGTGRGAAPAALTPEPVPVAPGGSTLVTGGGRDSVIGQAVAAARARGEAVLVLTPEMAGARAWAARLQELTGEPVATVTSGDPPGRRWRSWWAARQGSPGIAVGTRAATFLPRPGLGLLAVIDEEDPAHKAPDAPRWHGREVSRRRVETEGGRLVLASVAPSLEAWLAARAGQADLVEAPGPPWPAVHRLDLRGADETRCLLDPLREAVQESLGRGRPVLLVLNQLGYARVLRCAECGASRRCPRCRLPLAYHQAARALGCRLCGRLVPAASLCPRCRGRRLVPLGWGTERLEAEARAAFPGARVVRHDGALSAEEDTAAREAIQRGEARVIVGTRGVLALVAPGAVGVAALVLADTVLNRPDFRAAERTFQLGCRLGELVEPGGGLWLQSYYPDHPALTRLAPGDRGEFYAGELAEREVLGYPPSRRLALLLASGSGAPQLADHLAKEARVQGLEVLGPAPLSAGRVQVVLLGGGDLPERVATVISPLRGHRRLAGSRLVVDVDPVELP